MAIDDHNQETNQTVPIDERPEYRPRNIRLPLALNFLFALGVGMAVFFLFAFSSQERLLKVDDFRVSRPFGQIVFDEVRAAADEAAQSERRKAYNIFPENGPVPNTFASWSYAQQIAYLSAFTNDMNEQQMLEKSKEMRRQYDISADNQGVPVSLTYRKADLKQWMSSGLRKTLQPSLIYYGQQTLFAPEENPDALKKVVLDALPADERKEVDEEILDSYFDHDAINVLNEAYEPLEKQSILAASEMNLERYRATVESLSQTVEDLRAIQMDHAPTAASRSNLQYEITFQEGKSVYHNKNVEKKGTPIWSAPVTIVNGAAEVGEGPWQNELQQSFDSVVSMMDQPMDMWTYDDMTITFRIDTALNEADRIAQELANYPKIQSTAHLMMGVLFVSAVGWIVTLILTLAWTSNRSWPILRRIEGAVPVELLILACMGFLVLAIAMAKSAYLSAQFFDLETLIGKPWQDPLLLLPAALFLLFNGVGWLLLSSFFRMARQGRLYQGSILETVLRGLSAFKDHIVNGRGAKHRSVLFYLGLGGAMCLALFLGLALGSMSWGLILTFLVYLGGLYVVVRKDHEKARIMDAMRDVGAGNLGNAPHPAEFNGLEREMAEQINHFDSSLSLALEKSLKSERMQTELITNVSHDLRTPLTSIINYVALLQNPDLTDEQRAEYLKVLEKKAGRLKILMSDLIDVSKAISGAVQLDLEPLDIAEVVRQSLGEVENGWAPADLTPVINIPEGRLEAMADGAKLARVYENLLVNAQKYSQPGTRVYISVTTDGGASSGVAIDGAARGSVIRTTIKNTSRYPLNMDPETLFERFKRGDLARTSEGSGLGLSIAEHLMKQMGGRLELAIDGDLFTATVEVAR